LQQNELATPGLLAKDITDPNQAKEVGSCDPNEFEKLSLLQCFRWSEFKSSQVTSLVVKDAVSAVIENLQEKRWRHQEEITASIEELLKVLVAMTVY